MLRLIGSAGRAFFDANWGTPLYQLIETLDKLYRLAYEHADFPITGRQEDNLLHMSFLLCHRALLSAATATGSGNPEDGPVISRRALEAAKAALAVKVDPENFDTWRAMDARWDRWSTRVKGGKPKGSLPLSYKGVAAEPLYQEIQTVIGILSDSTVHFTPDHVFQYEWKETSLPDGRTERSFGVNEDAVAKEMLMLAEQHRLIIRVFDRCLDGRLLGAPQLKQVVERAENLYEDLLRREGFTAPTNTVGETGSSETRSRAEDR